MINLYSAANLPDAHIVLRLLTDAGIDARIFNENAQSAMGELPFTHAYPQIWLLNDVDFVRARKIIGLFERTPVDSGSIFCGACNEQNPGNFHICWKCSEQI